MHKKTILVTGGAGFVGSHLLSRFKKKTTCPVVVFDKLDKLPKESQAKHITYVKGNLTKKEEILHLFRTYGPFKTIYHLGSEMPNKLANDDLMWSTNVSGTFSVASEAARTGTTSFIFTSSNVTYGIPATLPVTEETQLQPIEGYGKSKVGAEQILKKFSKQMNIQIFRCPVITGVGRLGLQSILYEFISENKSVYVLGKGDNRYQFVDVEDVVDAMLAASTIKGFDIYTIGADDVLTLRELYQQVIHHAGSTSKIYNLPKTPAFFILWLMDKINYSPLGIYQITMMSRSIYADTTKIKKRLAWNPKKTNIDTFIENYDWYIQHKGNYQQIGGNTDSPNKSIPKMGILKLIKLFS